MRLNTTTTEPDMQMRRHVQLLGHSAYGVTELRTFEPRSLVAYADNDDDIVRLIMELDGKVSGIYMGVQPRCLDLLDKAPDCWKPMASSPQTNCTCDRDIEFITACFFDIDVASTDQIKGRPATEKELHQSLHAATLLTREDGLALRSTICCSGNGHYVLAPVVPIPVDGDEIPEKFRQFCHQVAEKIARQVSGIKVDPVYNLSRIMRLIGTVNGKG